MQKSSSMYKLIIYFAILMILVSPSCNVTAPTPTPERLQLVNGEIEACLLLGATEVEAVSGIQVTSKINPLLKPASCGYLSVKDGETVLVTYVFTDTTLKKMGESDSAVKWYELIKGGDLLNQKAAPETFKRVEDIDNLGGRAYFVNKWDSVEIHVLNNNIVYLFNTNTIDNGGIGYDALLKLAKIALPRMP